MRRLNPDGKLLCMETNQSHYKKVTHFTSKNSQLDNSKDDSFFLTEGVKKSSGTIRQRIDTILESRGEKWADVYNDLKWCKSFASIVHNGLLIPPNWQRVALAKRLGVDSSVIYKIPDLISADKIKREGGAVETNSPNFLGEDDEN